MRMVGRLTWNNSHNRRSLGKHSFHVPSSIALRIDDAACAESDSRLGMSKEAGKLLIFNYQWILLGLRARVRFILRG